ncbi:nuclease-related domain-containing protein [Thiomicrorhabdus sp.]|uniref:nuclease-related domain-containing protein n=1 Tax=Thiomicrorhabdus sp. TaxID=2039724 RepID=UPI002AA7F7C2|nr:nuclease-related domain-containing protein [Thiomicrorhabdus sp.]
MPIIKEYKSNKEQDLDLLNKMLNEGNISAKTQQKIKSQIAKIVLGKKAEQNAAYMLSKLVEKKDKYFLINDLRLEIDGSIAQIDHLILNRFGYVYLFETKNFSTGIKVDENEVFWRWDAYRKTYIEIPSPIEQSKRHEITLQKALDALGFMVTGFEHFVLVDYNAELLKPIKGFDNVCRPDMVEKAIKKAANNTGMFQALKEMASLIKNTMPLSHGACQICAEELSQMHQPIQIDYRKYFNVPEPHEVITVSEPQANYITKPKLESQLQPQNQDKANQIEFLTLPKMAKKLKISKEEFTAKLHQLGYFEKKNEYDYLTAKGKVNGIRFQKGRFGFYFLFPINFILK